MEARILNTIRDYVLENFLYARPDAELRADDPLIGSGVIDSMGILELVEFVQSEFGVAVDDAEITEENLGSIGAITRLIRSKAAASAEAAFVS
jgi:acyl carrier protein